MTINHYTAKRFSPSVALSAVGLLRSKRHAQFLTLQFL